MFYKNGLMGVVLIGLCFSCFSRDLWVNIPGGADSLIAVKDARTIYFQCIKRLNCKNKKFAIKIRGVVVPSLKGSCPKEMALAKKAKLFVEELVNNATSLSILHPPLDDYDYRDYENNALKVNLYTEKYDVAESLIKHKLGKKYIKGAVYDWCGS